MQLSTRHMIALTAAIIFAPLSSAISQQPGKPPVIVSRFDACTFFAKAELEAAVGYPLGPSKRGRNEPSCRFPNTRGTVTVRVGDRVTAQEFDELRQQIGAQAEPVRGVGDRAYFWGPRLYVGVGTEQLVLTVSTEQLTPQLRAGLTSLGRLGATRLR